MQSKSMGADASSGRGPGTWDHHPSAVELAALLGLRCLALGQSYGPVDESLVELRGLDRKGVEEVGRIEVAGSQVSQEAQKGCSQLVCGQQESDQSRALQVVALALALDEELARL